MSKQTRRRFDSQTKVNALKSHLVDNVKVSEIAEDLGIHPNVFYEWQKTFFLNGEKAFEKDNQRQEKKQAEQIKALEEQVQSRNEVLAEVMTLNVELKKKNGLI